LFEGVSRLSTAPIHMHIGAMKLFAFAVSGAILLSPSASRAAGALFPLGLEKLLGT
jgi:hypothetical protein